MSEKNLSQAVNLLLQPAALLPEQLFGYLTQMHHRAIDYADIYLQMTRGESWVLEDGIIREGSRHFGRGAGIRVNSGEKSSLAYTDDIHALSLKESAEAARSLVKQNQQQRIIVPNKEKISYPTLYDACDPLHSLPDVEKLTLLRALDAEARRQDSRVKEVIVSLVGHYEAILIANSEGQLCADIRPMVRVNVRVIVVDGDKRESGFAGGGGRYDYHYLLDKDRALSFAREAVRIALVNLHAQPAPAGTLPIVLGHGWPGVLLHEAVGHGLEGDFNRKGTSVFSGRIGEKVASSLCTVVDDGTIKGRRGSLSVDDEGTPSHCTTLIEKGVLKGYLQDRLNARLMKMQPTGNGRRESYAHLPMPRMTNTYLLSGQHTRDEIISSVKYGLYAVNFDGGQVDITSGKFVFSTSEAYLIENGRVTTPVKGATLIGSGHEVMSKVSMLGNDLELDPGVGICGKDGQSVPVGVGQPTLKVDALTVGGTG